VLPVAWIRGKNFFHRIAAWFFGITVQSPEWDDRMLNPFHDVGFSVRIGTKKMESSDLVFIIADKIITDNQ